MSAAASKVLVVGATGGIGRQVVAAAQRHEMDVTALVRDLARGERVLPGVELAQGDLEDAAGLRDSVQHADAVVFTHGSHGAPEAARRIDYGGGVNILRALEGRKPRIALMTSIYVARREDPTSGVGQLLDWKRRSERLVRVYGAPYTIVRPSWFDQVEPGDRRLVLEQGDRSDGGIGAARPSPQPSGPYSARGRSTMEHIELVLLFLLVAVAALAWLARVLDVPYPILLVLGGCVVGYLPGVPDVELDPDLVLSMVLPPLLFQAAVFASVGELRANARAISLNAFGLVLVTMAAVAVVIHAAIPELPWAAAFALGAIVSPTDPLAAIAISQRLGVPRRLTVPIEGESLINDGTALVAYRTAVAALGGSFSLLHASGDFLLNVAGVIAAVTAGLMVGHRMSEHTTASSRLRSVAFWDVLVFLLNALLFILVGLQLPGILEEQDRSAATLLGLGALVGVIVIAVRLAWFNTMPYAIRALDRRPQQISRRLDWRPRTVMAWAGLSRRRLAGRGAGTANRFPERDLLLWLTLCVIFATLVIQGLSLPALIRVLGIRQDASEAHDELRARKAAARAALDRIDELRSEDWTREAASTAGTRCTSSVCAAPRSEPVPRTATRTWTSARRPTSGPCATCSTPNAASLCACVMRARSPMRSCTR